MHGTLATLLTVTLLYSAQLNAGNPKDPELRKKTHVCEVWWALADPRVHSNLPTPEFAKLTDDEAVAGIGCLLNLEGKTRSGKFSGATRFEVSQTFPQATVELDALFLVSSIYRQQWAHADGVALVDASGRIQKPNSGAKRLFPFVKEWYRRINEGGLEVARRKNDDPLAGSGLHWY
jgi:hypothetical protein